MNTSKRAILLLIGIVLLFATACGGAAPVVAEIGDSAAAEAEEEHEGSSEDTHQHDEAEMEHLHVAAPEAYADLENPFGADHEAIEAGEEIFQTNCESCHGPKGAGDGPAAEELDPKPATLSDSMMMGSLSDGYLFWRVSKGGQMEPFNSAMPAWEMALTEQQRWQVISFVRSLSDDAEHHSDEEHAGEEMHSDSEEHMEEEHEEAHSDDEHTSDTD